MIRKISEILRDKGRTLSFEIYPPKTERGCSDLAGAIETLVTLEPDYISVTYHAGGGTADRSIALAKDIQERYGVTVLHHLTLVNQTVEELTGIIKRIRDAGVRNILALRGDPPKEMGKFRKIDGGLERSFELIDLIRDIGGDWFSIGVAGYPEGHVEAPTKEFDTKYLYTKLAHGGEFVITQMFFDNNVYTEYLKRTTGGCGCAPIIAGLLPVTDYDRLLSFCDTCGAYICDEVHKIFAPVRKDPRATLERGVDYAVRQAVDLFARGAPGIHFYALNKVEPVRTIWKAVKEEAFGTVAR